MGGGSIDDTTFLKVTATVLIMVIIAAMAQTDSNNPMAEIGIPFDANSFNIYHLANQAPQINMSLNTETPTVSCDVVTLCLNVVAAWFAWIGANILSILIWIANGILRVLTVLALLLVNFAIIFNFSAWGAFQGNLFLILFAIGLTALLGGSVMLWIYAKVTGAIPFVGGV